MIDDDTDEKYTWVDTVKGIVVAILICLIVIWLTGCSTTVGVTAKFPDSPSSKSLERCPDLQMLQDKAQLSDVADTVNVNYSTYYQCAVKSDQWIEWYQIQKKIFENATK